VAWFRQLFSRRRRYDELSESIREHINEKIADLMDQGVTREQAERTARREFGNVALIEERSREVWNWNRLDRFAWDFRISCRSLTRSPGFSMIAIAVIALCTGATTSLFTVVRSVLLRPLPFRDPSRLVMVYEHFRDPSMNTHGFNYNPVAPADYLDWRSQTNGFQDMAAYRGWHFNLTGEHSDLPEDISAGGGTWNLFPLLGVHAVLGRTFTESEDRPSGDVALLTWSLYERRFGGDSAIVGKQIHLDGQPYTVIGVLPKWFTWPDARIQIWIPFASGLPPMILRHHDFHFANVVARLRADVSLTTALSQVEALQYRLHLQNLNSPVAEDVAYGTLVGALSHNVKKPLTILLCAAICMLLIGCLNVANLMVARSAAKQKEIAIRNALGAQRSRLIREQLMESLLLSTVGGVAGVLLSLAATHWLVRIWRDLPSAQSIHADGMVLTFALALVCVTGLLAGLLPAIPSTNKRAIAALQGSSRKTAGSRARTTLRRTLLSVEIAATVVLLIAAGLLLKSLWLLRATELGCITDNVLTMSYSLPAKKYDSPDKVNAFNKALLERVRALPGVRAGALGSMMPGAGAGEDDAFTIPEHPQATATTAEHDALYRTIDPGYFSALEIPLLKGRFFSNDDRAGHLKTVIISNDLARQYFSGEDPLGKHLCVPARGTDQYQIVGVVADTLYKVGQPSEATMYFPVLNGESDEGLMIAVRTASDPLAMSIPVQKLFAELDPELPVSHVLTMQQIVARSLGNTSLSAGLVLAFAVLSLLLASVGLYGVLSYMTTQRTGEIGVRLALGAQREQVVRQTLGDGLRPALYGLVLGLTASVGAVRLIQSMLYGTRPLDPAIFAVVAATLLAVAALACLLPAWRASRLDPMQALRSE